MDADTTCVSTAVFSIQTLRVVSAVGILYAAMSNLAKDYYELWPHYRLSDIKSAACLPRWKFDATANAAAAAFQEALTVSQPSPWKCRGLCGSCFRWLAQASEMEESRPKRKASGHPAIYLGAYPQLVVGYSAAKPWLLDVIYNGYNFPP